ncbi:MAG: glycosyltransferase [Edaphocola sp.]
MRIVIKEDNSYFQVCIKEFVARAADFGMSVSTIDRSSQILYKVLRQWHKRLPLPRLHRAQDDGLPPVLSVTIGPDFDPIAHSRQRGQRNMYCFDCWPQNIPWVVSFTKLFGVANIFFSAKQSADAFNEQAQGRTRCKGWWVPEGIKADDYHFYPLAEKTIDVLEFGRRYDKFHDAISPMLAHKGYNHAYATAGKLLFPTEADFVEGLARAKVSVCFPSSITHPERSGNISTMTLRYLQSMAAKCLVVGKMPYDMRFLFEDYDPVVEIDEEGDMAAQLTGILENINDYEQLIERNFARVQQHHDWRNRIDDLLVHCAPNKRNHGF